MEFIGWLVCLIASLAGVFVAYVVVAMSGWSGRVDLVPLLIVLVLDSAAWYFTVAYAPFRIVMGG